MRVLETTYSKEKDITYLFYKGIIKTLKGNYLCLDMWQKLQIEKDNFIKGVDSE